MEILLKIGKKEVVLNFSKPIDISIALKGSPDNPRAWYQNQPAIEPVVMGDWVGKVSEGASVNFNNILFSPHAHGTHTESYGHISKKFYSVNDALKTYFFIAKLISVTPEKKDVDLVITKNVLKSALIDERHEAVIIRTFPNPISKKTKLWSNTNWPYLSEEAARYLRELDVRHLLIDLPSVDREHDEGKLLAHKAFWNFPENPRKSATITEMIFVPDEVPDGEYLLNLQTAAFENDATPARPVLYEILNR